jgi:arylsulfatase
MPNLTGGRTVFTYYAGAVGIPEAEAPKMVNRSWGLTAQLQTPDSGARGVIATIGGTGAGWALFLDQSGTPIFEYRLFEVTRQTLKGNAPLSPGIHTLQVNFDYDGDGYAKGGLLSLLVDGVLQTEARLPASPPVFFSINETFDVGIDTGSPAGAYPQGATVGYPLQDTVLKQVTVELR